MPQAPMAAHRPQQKNQIRAHGTKVVGSGSANIGVRRRGGRAGAHMKHR
jgi:hypothetical protein